VINFFLAAIQKILQDPLKFFIYIAIICIAIIYIASKKVPCAHPLVDTYDYKASPPLERYKLLHLLIGRTYNFDFSTAKDAD
jgi:hypothetical protein